MIRAQIAFDDMEQGWPMLLRYVMTDGAAVKPRGLPTREVIAASFTLRDPSRAVIHTPALRKLNHAFGAVEFLWVVNGEDEADTLGFYNSKMLEFADVLPSRVGGAPRLFGAYGPPIAEQLPYVVDNLRRDPDSRQAVITIWRPSPPATKDVPCTVSLQFLLREGRLQAVTTMRSNDLFLGTPYDVPLFCRLQSYVASVLGVGVGHYHHQAGSLHVYERNMDDVQSALLWQEAGKPAGPRPAELVVGPFDAGVGKAYSAWCRASWAADEEPYFPDRPYEELGQGWSDLARLAVEYARRKHEREASNA